MAILYCYWHLVVKHWNFTLLLTSSSQQWQFPPPHSTVLEDRVISSLFNVVIETQRQIYLPVQHYQRTGSSLHCSMLSLRLKGRYTPAGQHYQRTEWSLHCSMLSLRLKGRYTPHSTLSEDRVISSLFNVVIETQRQIYPPGQHSRGQSDLFTVQCCHWHSKADIPPIQHYQRTEWSLHCSMLSLRLKGRYIPQSTLTEDRVISSLFNVVIDTQRQIYPPSQHYQRTEWSLHCSMLSLTLKGRYTPQSTLAEDRVISSLFNVVIDTERQIYPPSFEQQVSLIARSSTMHIYIYIYC